MNASGYDRVCSNLGSITRSLKGTPGAREALTAQYIQDMWLNVMEHPTEKELVTLALTRIEQDPSQYDKFLTMLQNIEGMDLIVKRLCGHEQPPNLVSMEPQGQISLCQSQATSSSISESHVAVVQEEAAQLQDQFVTVLTHTKIFLIKKEAEDKEFLRAFKVTLTTLPLSKKHQHLLFLEQEKARISEAKKVEEILDALEPYWNYSNYAFLEHIVKEFGTSGLQEEMKNYIVDLEQFEMMTTIKDCEAAGLDKIIIPKYFREMAIKQRKEPTTCTLYEVRQLENKVVNRSAVSSFTLFRCQVTSSSVNIILAFPPEAYADISEVFDCEFRERHNIVSLESSDVTTVEKGMSSDKLTIGEVHHVGEHTEELETTVPGYIPSAAMASELGLKRSSSPEGIREIKKELRSVAHNWRGIGRALRLHRHVLHRIEDDYVNRYGETHCLEKTLIHWLRRDYDTTRYGQPSWQMLVAAVADPAGGNNRALAEQIAARHNVQVGRF